MTAKSRFIIRVMKLVILLAQIVTEVRDLVDIYADRGFAPGGSDPIVTADFDKVQPLDGIDVQKMTITQFNEVATMLTNVLAYINGQAAPTADHAAVINKYRQDM